MLLRALQVLYATNPFQTGGPLRLPPFRMVYAYQKIYNVVSAGGRIGNLIRFRMFGGKQGHVMLTGNYHTTGENSYEVGVGIGWICLHSFPLIHLLHPYSSLLVLLSHFRPN